MADQTAVAEQEEPGLPTYEELGEYLDDFSDALSSLIAGPLSSESAAQMVETERKLQRIRRRCSAHPRLRPSIAQHEAVAQITAHFSELWPKYAQALQAPALDEAQRLASQGQDSIDAATEEVGKYTSLIESTRAYEDLTIPDLLERSLNALAFSYPGLDLLGLDRLGAQEAERVTGVHAHPGQGAQFLILDAVGSVHFDPERLQHLLRETSRLCGDSSRLSEVASQSDALEGLATSSRLVYEALEVFESALSRVKDDQALMRRIIKFYGEFYEDVASPILAWYNLVAGIKAQPYAKLIQQDATELARNLSRQERTAFLLEDDGAFLRNASQHGNSFTMEGEHVTFRLRRHQGTMPRAEVIDRIFSFVESVLAMSWSLSNALARLGIEAPVTEDDASYMNLTPFRLATLWLESRGTTIVEANESSTSWDLTLVMDREDIFTLALAFAQHVPEGISKVSVRAPGAVISLIAPFAAFERFEDARESATVPVDHLMAIIEFRAECMAEGKSILTASDLQYAAGSIGLFLLKTDDYSLIPSLRKVHQLTISHSTAEITSVVKRVFDLTRAPSPVGIRQLEVTLNRWTDGPVPTLPTFEAVTVHK
ncbi:hypothetical protein ACWG8W_07550 [Citricoccus zhacaiensis]